VSRGKGHISIRTCLSCRRKGSKKSMIRMTLGDDGKILVDVRYTAPGRGAYVCRKRECLDALARGGMFGRAFRRKGVVQTGPKDLTRLRREMTRLALP
jgi:uncharacterized protein